MDNKKIISNDRMYDEFEKVFNESGVADIYSIFGDIIQKAVFLGHFAYWASLQTEDKHAVSVVSYLTKIVVNYHANYVPLIEDVNEIKTYLKNASIHQKFEVLTGFQLIMSGFSKSLVETEGKDKALKITDETIDELYSHISKMQYEERIPFPILIILEGTPWIEDKIKSMNGKKMES